MTYHSASINERRRHARLSTPVLSIRIAGRDHTTHNWSLGGCLIEGYRGPLGPGSLLTVIALGERGGPMVSVCIAGRVLRADLDQHRLAVAFLLLDADARAVLGALTAETASLPHDCMIAP